jgi:hypothetical protein
MNKIYYKQTKPNYKSSTLQAFPKKAEKDLTEAYPNKQTKENNILHKPAALKHKPVAELGQKTSTSTIQTIPAETKIQKPFCTPQNQKKRNNKTNKTSKTKVYCQH